jgi:hypothetical protein
MAHVATSLYLFICYEILQTITELQNIGLTHS